MAVLSALFLFLVKRSDEYGKCYFKREHQAAAVWTRNGEGFHYERKTRTSSREYPRCPASELASEDGTTEC